MSTIAGTGMLDLLGILFSSSLMFLVILRAIQLDNLEPWFRPPKTGTDDSGLKLRPENGVFGTRTTTAPEPEKPNGSGDHQGAWRRSKPGRK